MSRTLMTAAILISLTGAALAQSDPIVERQKIYKGMGQAAKEPAQMLQGKAAFELTKVQAALRTIEESSQRLPDLFPETSKTGHDTEALPVIWEKKDDFLALFKKLNGDAKAALVSIKDEASFKTEFPKVLGDCGTCHKQFRAKK